MATAIRSSGARSGRACGRLAGGLDIGDRRVGLDAEPRHFDGRRMQRLSISIRTMKPRPAPRPPDAAAAGDQQPVGPDRLPARSPAPPAWPLALGEHLDALAHARLREPGLGRVVRAREVRLLPLEAGSASRWRGSPGSRGRDRREPGSAPSRWAMKARRPSKSASSRSRLVFRPAGGHGVGDGRALPAAPHEARARRCGSLSMRLGLVSGRIDRARLQSGA